MSNWSEWDYEKNLAAVDILLKKSKTEPLNISSEELNKIRTEYLPIMKGYSVIVSDLSASMIEMIDKKDKDNSAKALHKVDKLLQKFLTVVLKFSGDKEFIREAGETLEIQSDDLYGTVMKHEMLLKRVWSSVKKYFFSNYDLLTEAVEKGDNENIIHILKQISGDWRILHDAFTETINKILYIASEDFHPSSVISLLRETACKNKSAYDTWSKLTKEELVEVVAKLLIAHGSKFIVKKENDKTTFAIDYCASGGKLCNSGGINELPALGLDIEEGSRLSYKYNYVPYCAHCIIWNEILPKEWYGRPLFYVEPDPLSIEKCNLIVRGTI